MLLPRQFRHRVREMSNKVLSGLGIDGLGSVEGGHGVLPSNVNDLSQDDLASLRSNNTFGSSRHSKSRNGSVYMNSGSKNGLKTYTNNLQIPIMVKRFFKPPTLDFETALWEMLNLIREPKRVYRSLHYHKQTKNRWARDDPSFVILLAVLLTISAVLWGLVYSPGVLSIINLVIYMVFIDFFLIGAVVSSIGWVLANKLFKKKDAYGRVVQYEEDIEWAFCFDTHCNSFLGIWISLYLVQFILLPALRMDNWLGLFMGNTLYFVSISYYFVMTFYGYSAIPFLENTQFILAPIAVLSVLYVISLFGFNVAKFMTEFYFS